MPPVVHTEGVNEVNVIGIVDGGAFGLELVALIVTSSWPAVTPAGAGRT